ncbi:hypothetical protein PLEOSDRAFT_1097207 [Pleurotus ostreatus PC15]|uniref:Uncharacterized protein n=1 Tax=Pleurotus ostreatus (strain PC15) TaxID=1137138 RepID=A0A067NHK7_PLEO1|nr:hypothetical protein PLEOSDRAFT_1097207 [Pleurotus ostreatus PC15]
MNQLKAGFDRVGIPGERASLDALSPLQPNSNVQWWQAGLGSISTVKAVVLPFESVREFLGLENPDGQLDKNLAPPLSQTFSDPDAAGTCASPTKLYTPVFSCHPYPHTPSKQQQQQPGIFQSQTIFYHHSKCDYTLNDCDVRINDDFLQQRRDHRIQQQQRFFYHGQLFDHWHYDIASCFASYPPDKQLQYSSANHLCEHR